MRRAWLIVVVGAALATRAHAEPPTRAPRAMLEVDGREVPVGKPFKLRVIVDHAPGLTVTLPEALPLPDQVHELARAELAPRYSETTTRRTFEIRIVAFELGQIYLAPVTLKYSGTGFDGHVVTHGAFVEVVSGFEGSEPELRPAAPPVGVLERDLTLVWYTAAAVAGLLLLVSVVRAVGRIGRRRRVQFASPEAMAGSPQDAALARLRELAESGLLDRPDRRPLYFAMSEALREFIGRVYTFDALELTTSELLATLAKLNPPQGWRVELGSWLEETDLVKYAGVRATRAVAADTLDRAMEFVENMPAPTPPGEEPAAEAATDEPGPGSGSGSGKAPDA